MTKAEVIKLSYHIEELYKINDIHESIKQKCYTIEEEKQKKQELNELIKKIKNF